ncbi:MAG: hypothetical protein ACRC7H_08265, partial [Plesiomonas shigelloides]
DVFLPFPTLMGSILEKTPVMEEISSKYLYLPHPPFRIHLFWENSYQEFLVMEMALPPLLLHLPLTFC